jgi:hypothetical protein
MGFVEKREFLVSQRHFVGITRMFSPGKKELEEGSKEHLIRHDKENFKVILDTLKGLLISNYDLYRLDSNYWLGLIYIFSSVATLSAFWQAGRHTLVTALSAEESSNCGVRIATPH